MTNKISTKNFLPCENMEDYDATQLHWNQKSSCGNCLRNKLYSSLKCILLVMLSVAQDLIAFCQLSAVKA